MTFLAVSLLVFSISILFVGIIGLIWWKKYGKSLFSTINNLKTTQNPSDLMKNIGNMGNLSDFYKKMGYFDDKTGDFGKRMDQIMKNMDKLK
jgi:hypothetical protein